MLILSHPHTSSSHKSAKTHTHAVAPPSPQRTFNQGSSTETVQILFFAELLRQQLDSSSSVAPLRQQELVIQLEESDTLKPLQHGSYRSKWDSGRNTSIPTFDGDANWESWRTLMSLQTWLGSSSGRCIGTAFILNEGMDGAALVSRTVHALLVTKCEGEALSRLTGSSTSRVRSVESAQR